MPIYEFYCQNCNTIYKFFSRTVNTEKIPLCPKCDNVKLRRSPSVFATISSLKDEGGADDLPFDEAQMEKAMTMLAQEAENMNEDDPRQAAQLMRKLSEATGLNMGPGMEEALRRMESGEDPDKIEEEMGDLLDEDELFILKSKGKVAGEQTRPSVDDHLYDL